MPLGPYFETRHPNVFSESPWRQGQTPMDARNSYSVAGTAFLFNVLAITLHPRGAVRSHSSPGANSPDWMIALLSLTRRCKREPAPLLPLVREATTRFQTEAGQQIKAERATTSSFAVPVLVMLAIR